MLLPVIGGNVRAECFACDAAIEAEDVKTICDLFVAHGQSDHDWSHPEQAVRNYAQNFAEVAERQTGGTERLTEIGGITVHPVTEERLDDWLRFFDNEAFADNPEEGSCYCLSPHDPETDEPELLWTVKRAAMIERIRTRGTFGYLAYVDDNPAGWVNASARSDYGLFASVDPDGPDPSTVIGVSCFVIAPAFRKHGVASHLLDRVIEDAPSRGASWIEGYPRDEPFTTHSFRGPKSMYDARGFEVIETRDRDTVVRLPVK